MEENKVCFITGSGSGNGFGMGMRLVERGYDLAIHHSGRDPRGAEELKARAEALGRRAEILVEDLSQPGAAGRLFGAFRERFSRLDLFINNAGVTKLSSLAELQEELFDRVVSIDFRAAAFCVKEACLFFREKGIRGSVVVIASNHRDRLWPRAAVYGSTKEALSRFVKYAAVEFAPDGVRVNCLAPGYIDREYHLNPEAEKLFRRIERTEIPLHRFVKSSELADWAEFLSGPAAASITGQTIDLDGGASLLNDSMEAYGLVPEE